MGTAKKSSRSTVFALLLVALLIIILPVMLQKGAEFGGSDDAASQMVMEIEEGYEPWATPAVEQYFGGELSGELESLLFCVQTGIGVGIIAFLMGRMVERKKWTDAQQTNDQ